MEQIDETGNQNQILDVTTLQERILHSSPPQIQSKIQETDNENVRIRVPTPTTPVFSGNMEDKSAEGMSILQIAAAMFEESLLTGVPNIISERRISWKTTKIISVVFCMAWFTYQLFEFMDVYLKYPTVKESRFLSVLSAEDSIPFVMSGIVVCNNNP